MYSVEEVAEQLGFSKVTIYAKLKKHKDMVVIKHGKKYIPDDLLSVIKSELNFKNDLKSKDIDKNEKPVISNNNEDLIKLNKGLYDTLLNQLSEKDKQIEKMQITIDELISLNKNSQVLLKQQQDKEIKKMQLEEHFQEVDLKLLELREKMQQKGKQKKKGLFGFFSKNRGIEK